MRTFRPFLLAGLALAATLAFASIPVPQVLHSDRGDIPIFWVPRIDCDGVNARGCYFREARKVWIITGMSRDSTAATIRHEQCHASLGDAGIQVDSISYLDPKADHGDQKDPEDYVCEALAWAWVSEKRHGH